MDFCKFTEPFKKYEIQVWLIPVDKVIIPSIQRDMSKILLQRLKNSISKVWFVDPILVIPSDEEWIYEVINWQHRLEAAKELGITEIPAVILPKFAKDYIIALNTEKWPTLRDKAHQAFEIFQTYKNTQPNETEANIMFDRVDEPYYITVWFVIDYFKDEKFPGYAFERVLKRIDNFLDIPMKEAEQERINRAKKLIEVKEILNQKYEEMWLKNALQKETIVSKAWQNIYWPRVRIIEDDFYTALEKLKQEIPNVNLTQEELQHWV